MEEIKCQNIAIPTGEICGTQHKKYPKLTYLCKRCFYERDKK